jgi:Cu(I)/Ag(I) efflux system membrane fusion protein
MNFTKTVLILTLGALTGAGTMYFFNPINSTTQSMSSATSDEPQPLYWVAPMDPNYRRDAPGKSPMGMDLVPVYEEGSQNNDSGPGTISISPEVVNNLGVRTATVELAELSPEVRTVGYLQYNQDKIIHIHPRVEGWIEKSFVNTTGDPVKKGQALYDLYSPELVNAQEELIFGLTRKDQRLVKAAEDRLKALQISSSFIERLKKSRKVSQTIRFYAPVNGVADNVKLQDGYYVKPGMTLLSIANLDQIWVEAEIFERQASLVKAGLPVAVQLDFLPGQDHQGTVDYVYPTLDPQTRTLRVRVRLENPGHRLKPNMFAELRIQATDEKQRLLIPHEALIRGSGQDRVVLALGDGRFKSVAVRKGLRDNQFTEILEGLNEGEEIVTSAQFLLDSESSKSSDFKRMNKAEETVEKPAQVWVEVTFNSINTEQMKANVDHGTIEDWQWPQMTMDFNLDPYLDIDELKVGITAHAQITRDDKNQYAITDIHIPEPETEKNQSDTSTTTVDHSQHNMSIKPEQTSLEPDATPELKQVNKVWVKATINSVDTGAMKLNAQHEAIPEWQWPSMTMDFQISEWVELNELPTSQLLHLEVSRKDSGGYEITDFYLPEGQ